MSIQKYKNLDLLADALGQPKDEITWKSMATRASSRRAACYYIAPYYYCAISKDTEARYLPRKLYADDDNDAVWEKCCSKMGRTLYRTLDGNKPPAKEPLELDDTTFEWFIGPLADIGDVN